MKEVTIKLYHYSELNAQVQEEVYQQFKYLNVGYSDWYDMVYYEFIGLCQRFGVTVFRNDLLYNVLNSYPHATAFNASVNVPELLEAVKNKVWNYTALDLKIEIPEYPERNKWAILMKKGSIDIDVRFQMYKPEMRTRSILNPTHRNGSKKYIEIDDELNELWDWFNEIANQLNKCLFKLLTREFDAACSRQAVGNTIVDNGCQFLPNGTLVSSLANPQ